MTGETQSNLRGKGTTTSNAAMATSILSATQKNAAMAASSVINMKLRMARVWDVKIPPVKMHVVAGKLVPTVRGTMKLLIKRKRRLALEIYGPEINDRNKKKDYDKEEASLIEGKDSDSARWTGKSSGVLDMCQELKDDDFIVIRILKPRRGRWGFNRDSDDESSDEEDDEEGDNDEDETEEEDVEPERKASFHSNPGQWFQDVLQSSNRWTEMESEEWIEYRKYGLDGIVDEKFHKRKWEATFGLGSHRERREIYFADSHQAHEFQEQINGLKKLVKERAQHRLEAYKFLRAQSMKQLQESLKQQPNLPEGVKSRGLAVKDSLMNMEADGEINLLVEIVSAQDLPYADKNATDPYVSVYLGAQKIHRTKWIPKDINPVWTVDTGSLLIVSCSVEDFFSMSSGLVFRVYDFDTVTKDELVGECAVSQVELLQMTGERTPFDLTVPHKLLKKRIAGGYYTPKLYLRVRKATQEDKDFIKTLNKIKRAKKTGVHADASFLSPVKESLALLHRDTKKVHGERLYRVKPRPDPTRPEEETKWLTMEAIKKEMMKPSYEYIEAGTGILAKMYVEILKCDDLPNMDQRIPGIGGVTDKGFTDAFCTLIFEDAIVNTDVIRDDLNPRWVPWSQRAFVFRVSHPSSQLLIGVFDYDLNRTPGIELNSHDAIGRITVDVTNIRPKTEYILSYNLFHSVLDNDRTPNGKLTLRLRMEYENFQAFTLGAIRLPPANYINVAKKNDFKTAYFVCNGEENMNRFSMEDLMAFRTELESLIGLRYHIRRAALTVVFWRGHKEVKIFGRKFKLPLHSMVAFTLGTTLIENYNLLPSYCLFCISWILAATNEQRLKNPSPWHGSTTIAEMWYALIRNYNAPDNISEYENEAAIRAYEETLRKRYEEEMDLAKERRERAKAVQEFFAGGSTQPEEISDDQETKLRGVPSINPLAVALFPIQQILGMICKFVRIIRSVLMWDDCFTAFFLWNACLVIGIVFLWVPWEFLVRWLSRVVIWTFFGPWMIFVDLFVLPRLLGTNVDKDEALRKFAKEQVENIGVAKEAILHKKEQVMKERAMKRYMFGKYAVKIPRLKEYRYRDIPLPESSAKPCLTPCDIKIKRRSHGQTLVGDMIPTWGDAVDQLKESKKEQKIEK